MPNPSAPIPVFPGQYFDARGRREITDHRPTVNLYLPHQQGTSPYYLLEADDAERLGVALLQEAGLARKAATLLDERHGGVFHEHADGWHGHDHTDDGSP